MGTMRQLSLAKLDLDLHRDWVQDSSQAVDDYLKDRLKDYHFNFSTPTRPIICNFGHLFSSSTGYAAGYYSYKWAEVLDADAFTRFQKEGLLNPTTGLAFRNTILAKGNSEDPYQLFQDFMGRTPQTDALLKRDGIIA
jgi:oligopeptidase A